ncbi:beta-phosphoglucomutase family hydrolase [Baekduia soli]|uniref:Beta-phosphoglucomutase n=1 Tax=Baekduia soli TaxID=496014 RepID=A0A5B8UBG1_9ACTN|nr:beta-phosphoglucomutase family hydrolase [Baekduia soli]QEC50334.1 beta-phosphoglucomutase family hydrolase [Baekduia soli]
MLGLPDPVTACLFDLDGVLTQTAKIHAAAWKQLFDEYLRDRARRTGEEFVPFDAHADYDEHVDGLPRDDGVRGFLSSRGIEVDDDEVRRLGDRKNELVQQIIERDGVQAYDGSIAYVHAARDAGLRRAVVSSSSNCRAGLQAAGILDLFEEIVDGHVTRDLGLRGKPAPDSFLEGARRLGVPPDRAAVFEDALAGVQAGRDGGFGYVVGVDRVGQRDALRAHGADVVVDDLADLT